MWARVSTLLMRVGALPRPRSAGRGRDEGRDRGTAVQVADQRALLAGQEPGRRRHQPDRHPVQARGIAPRQRVAQGIQRPPVAALAGGGADVEHRGAGADRLGG
jgi:hypothetical protein